MIFYRLLLGNLDDLHKIFCKKYPEVKLSQSKFTKLRPRQCIKAGQSGSHNVCVCVIHQNVKLKVEGIVKTLQRKGLTFADSYRDLLNDLICESSNPQCCLLQCEDCPRKEVVQENLMAFFELEDISEIEYYQWVTTDR